MEHMGDKLYRKEDFILTAEEFSKHVRYVGLTLTPERENTLRAQAQKGIDAVIARHNAEYLQSLSNT